MACSRRKKARRQQATAPRPSKSTSRPPSSQVTSPASTEPPPESAVSAPQAPNHQDVNGADNSVEAVPPEEAFVPPVDDDDGDDDDELADDGTTDSAETIPTTNATPSSPAPRRSTRQPVPNRRLNDGSWVLNIANGIASAFLGRHIELDPCDHALHSLDWDAEPSTPIAQRFAMLMEVSMDPVTP